MTGHAAWGIFKPGRGHNCFVGLSVPLSSPNPDDELLRIRLHATLLAQCPQVRSQESPHTETNHLLSSDGGVPESVMCVVIGTVPSNTCLWFSPVGEQD